MERAGDRVSDPVTRHLRFGWKILERICSMKGVLDAPGIPTARIFRLGHLVTDRGGAKPPQFIRSLYAAPSLAGGLGLLVPFVALALVLAYGSGHLHGAFCPFLGFMTATALGALCRER